MFQLNGGPKPQSEGCRIYVRLHWRLSSTVKSAKPEQRGPLCVEGGAGSISNCPAKVCLNSSMKQNLCVVSPLARECHFSGFFRSAFFKSL